MVGRNREKNITVCMATYNGEPFVLRQIESILRQLGRNDELVISDDNSSDKTVSIIETIKDSRIKLVVNTGPKGIKNNFQNALLHATSDYIFLADQDDIWFENKVLAVCSFLEEFDLVLTDCEVISSEGKQLIPSFFNYRGSRPGFWSNLFKNSYVGCCMAFKRSVLDYTLPFPEKIHMHDWWIGLQVERKGKVKFLEQPLISYVRHGNNASPTGEVSKFGWRAKFINRFLLLYYTCLRP